MMNTVQTAPPHGMGNRIHSSDGKQDVIVREKKRKKKGGINFFSYLIIIIIKDNDNDNDNNVDIIKCYYQSHVWKGNISLEIYYLHGF